MTDIVKYLSKKTIVFLQSTTRDEALCELISQLESAKMLKDKQAFFEAILAREGVVSTGIGMGVAIPHAKLAGYKDFFIAVGIQREEGIPWNSLDGAPVRLVFLIGGPDDKQTEYLQILSRLTTAIKSPERRKAVLNVESPKELIELFKED